MHCGIYFDTYYSPNSVINALSKNGIKKAWISSTTACMAWQNSDEKDYIINKIEKEIQEAVTTAEKNRMTLIPLYWVSYQRYIDGEHIDHIMKGSLYKGFKIHPKSYGWDRDEKLETLLEEVCEYAGKHALPILIHTGSECIDAPNRFEVYFKNYSSVKFVLAHCKATEQIIRILTQYHNVYGDTSFCSYESYDAICKAGFKDKMLFGTDFPITHWYTEHFKKGETEKENLYSHYKSLVNQNVYIGEVQIP